MGARMEMAIALGGDPVYVYAASAPLPPAIDELNLAGFLRRKSAELVKCKTVDVEVPADSDIVVEGYLNPGELREEGPFGDHTGWYSLADDYPVFHVTAITRKREAIYPTTIVGRPPMEGLLARRCDGAHLPPPDENATPPKSWTSTCLPRACSTTW